MRWMGVWHRLQGSPVTHVLTQVLQLKKSLRPVRIDIVGNRRTAELNGMLQHFAEGQAEPFQLGTGETTRSSARTDSGVKQTLVGIDVADTGEEGLIQKCGLDDQLSRPRKMLTNSSV